MDDQAPPGSTSNAPPTQLGEFSLAYLDDIKHSPSHEGGGRGTQTSIGYVTSGTLSQQLSGVLWLIQ